MAQVGLNMASKWPPRGLKKVQDDFQDGSRAPKRLQDGQERSKTAQNLTRPPGRDLESLGPPQYLTRRPKRPSRRPLHGPRGPQDGPSGPHDRPKRRSRQPKRRPRIGQKWVRFGSPALWTGALGVNKVPGIVSPYSRDEKTPKQAQNSKNKFLKTHVWLKIGPI